jgi:gliding motility-associated-like protein
MSKPPFMKIMLQNFEQTKAGMGIDLPKKTFLALMLSQLFLLLLFQLARAGGDENSSVIIKTALTAGTSFADTVQAVIPANTTSDFCIDPAVFDYPGNVTSAGFCGQGNPATVFATSIDLEYVTLVPAPGFVGTSPDLICTVHCFNNSASQCDTTYISVLVQGPVSCDDVFPNDTVSGHFFGNPTSFCVQTPLSQLQGYGLVFNGQPLNNPFDCKFEPTTGYSYSLLPGGGFSGPYTLISWNVNGNNLTGFFNNANDLLDLMNFLDPTGNWQINLQGAIIFGGNSNSVYGNMNIKHNQSGINTVLTPNQIFIPTGFTVGLSIPGINVLIATDSVTGCADTLYIDATPDPTITEIVELTTTVNTPTSQICLDGSELPGGAIFSLGYCGGPANGSAPLVNDSCVYYIPNLNFAGQDTFCMLVCDGGFPVQICDTTFIIVNVLPEVDTVNITIPAGETTLDSCLSGFVIELPGAITSSEFCGINQNEVTAGINGNCLALNVVNNFTGTSELCVVHCSGSVCDTNIIIVTVEPPVICSDVFTQNSISLASITDTGFLCIPIALGEIGGYTVTVDGNIFTQSFTPCNFSDVVIYNYSALPAGPYILDSWTANGITFTGSIANINSLVDSMNIWDPTGGWVNNLTTQTIQGGLLGGNYSDIIITPAGGNSATLPVTTVQMALGSQMPVTGFGSHEIITTASNGCADTVTVVLEQHFISTDTIYMAILVNTPLNALCGNTNELLGNLASLNFCGLPANGGIVQTNTTCVAYTPNTGFTGTDEFCFVLCDDSQIPVCDTFIFVIEVLPPVVNPVTDTLFISAPGVTPFDTCLTAGVLQLPGTIVSGQVCGANAGEVSLTVNGTCVTVDLADNFTGTTTACVVHCNDANPVVCDTTILVISFDTTGVTPCPQIFNPDEIFISLDNNTGEVCLPVPVTAISNFDILVDGVGYAGSLVACDFDSAYIYFYGLVFGQGNQGPYSVSWQANANTFTATVGNMTELVGLMNDWDPNGDWVLDPTTFTIVSGNNFGIYGNMVITHTGTGIVSNLAPDFNGIPAGTQITISGVGLHEVVLINQNDGCTDTLAVHALSGVDVLDVVTVENVPSQIVCLDTSVLPGNFTGLVVCQAPQNGMLIVSGNCFTYNPNNGFIGSDQGCIAVCDDLGNCDTTLLNITVDPLCSLFDFFPAGVQEYQVGDCSATATYCVPVKLDSIANFGVLDNGVQYAGGFVACNANFTQITLDTGFHEIIFIHLNTGCQDTLLADVICQPDSTGCGIAALSPLSLTVDCDSLAQFCVGVSLADLPNFLVEDNGAPFTGTIGACDLNSQFTGVQLDTGLHVVVFTDTVKGCSDTFLVDVGCQIFEDVTVDVEVAVDDSLTLCLEDYDFQLTLIDSVVNACSGTGNATFGWNDQTLCVTVFGEIIGLDTACFQVFFADTSIFFNVNVTVTEPCPDFIPGDLIGGGVDCSLDSGWVCLPVSPANLLNKLISLDGLVYNQPFEPCNFDSIFTLNYSNLPSQGLIGPYIVESWTVNGAAFTGVFNTPQELADSMNVWDPAGNWQIVVNPIDQTIFITGGNAANTYGVMVVEQNATQVQVDLGIDATYAPGGVAIYIPVGSFQLTVTDTVTLCTDQTTVELTCVAPEFVTDTIFAGVTDTFCLDLSELLGTVDTIFNACPGSLGETVSFIFDGACVIYTGNEPGLDSACIVVCDDVGVCDTTYFFITVLSNQDSLPIAVNDTIFVDQDQTIFIDVFGNDTVVGLTQFFILDQPAHGTAVFLPDGSVNYVPEANYCDETVPDSFTYVICNLAGCDTATVFVTVQCTGFEVFDGFSPNEDGVNDFFKITGLQNYPNHKLYVYNRWGNLIFEAVNYQSDWDGIWNGRKVPDGTYFYLLDLGDGSKPRSGYIQIMR